MRHTTTIMRALAAALAVSALAAAPALAHPIHSVDRQVDRVDPAAAGSILYDNWRSEQARIAEHPRGPGHPSEVTLNRAPIVTADKPDAGDDDVWPLLGIALAATGVAAGSGAVAARRYRVRARRVPA